MKRDATVTGLGALGTLAIVVVIPTAQRNTAQTERGRTTGVSTVEPQVPATRARKGARGRPGRRIGSVTVASPEIDAIGRRWALTILCDGEHTVYVDETTEFELQQYRERFVQAHYVYVERTVPDPRCIRAPCGPVVEHRLKLITLAVVSMTDDNAEELRTNCTSRGP